MFSKTSASHIALASRIARGVAALDGCALPLKLAAAAALAAGLGACSSPPVNARGAVVPQAMYQPAEAADAYAQTAWELARWTRPGDALQPVPRPGKQQPITLVFLHERGQRQISGWAGCNSYTAEYTVANGSVLLNSPPRSTRRACGDAKAQALEQDYLTGLAGIRASRLDPYENPRRLTLTLPTGDVLDFARSAQAGAPAAPATP